MAYIYCYHCNTEMGIPTLEEKLSRDYRCPRCNRNNWDCIDADEFHEGLIELLNRVKNIEKIVLNLTIKSISEENQT